MSLLALGSADGVQYELSLDGDRRLTLDEFTTELAQWHRYGKETIVDDYGGVPVFVNEFWTSKQRAEVFRGTTAAG